MFAKQVSSHCKANVDTPVAKCKHDLLVYGVDKLERMTDLHLDAMDPYQRGANDISKFFGHTLLFSFVICRCIKFNGKGLKSSIVEQDQFNRLARHIQLLSGDSSIVRL